MPLNPSFQQYSFNYSVEGEDGEILSRIIRNSWNARTRESIISIQPSDEWNGNVYEIQFGDDKTPPTIGGYVEGLIRHGWGYLYYDKSKLYVCRIIPHNEGYRFEGRESVSPEVPPIRTVPNNVVNEKMPINNSPSLRDEKRVQELAEHVKSVWSLETLETIKDVKYSSSDYNCYIINTINNTEIEDDGDGTPEIIHEEIPDSPLGENVDALLRDRWCVASIKGNSLFISRIIPTNEQSFTQNSYKFENSEKLMYVPKLCHFCGEHEYYHMVVTDTRESGLTDDNLPVYARSCLDCSGEEEFPTSEEYHDRE